MNNIKIYCVMRIKNEERWIESCLTEASKVADQILIIDDGSTDKTGEICKSFSKVQYRYYERTPNEWRDRSELLSWALESKPDWILILDGDEVLEEGAAERIRYTVSRLDPRDPVYAYFSLRILYFWNEPEYYRCEESIYGNFWIPRLFTTWGQDIDKLFIATTIHGHNLHANGVPPNLRGKGARLDVCVKHYGYLDAALREQKYQFYQKHDKEATDSGYYDHLTSEHGMSLAKWQNRDPKEMSSGLFIKPIIYYRNVRLDVAGIVPDNAIKILDVGCGQGYLGASLKKQNPKREVIGVELDSMAAAAAEENIDRVIVGNIEKIQLNYPEGYFDCIIMTDIIEHLYNPWETLIYLKKYLNNNGSFIFSVPNVRNITVLDQLVNKCQWKYQEAGILDNTHIRFFTFEDIKEMLYSTNMTIDLLQGVRDPAVSVLGSTIESNKMVLRNLSTQEINELQTIQFLVRAKVCSPIDKPNGLVSIIIPSCNQLELTKVCLESISLYTNEKHEIIVVDNGSASDTIEYLQSLGNIKLICNDSNQGFAAACNQGMAAAKGEYICLLNNDTVVTQDWLRHLVYHLNSNPEALVVGPMSNYASEAQTLVVKFKKMSEVQKFGHKIRNSNWLKSVEKNFLSGFCLMMKSNVKDIIGGFDTRFWPGNFEDNDYCLRIKLAGYKILIARDVYIHHFGSKTFSGEKFIYKDTLINNWQKFREKWGLPEDYNIRELGHLCESLAGKYKREEVFIPLDQEGGREA